MVDFTIHGDIQPLVLGDAPCTIIRGTAHGTAGDTALMIAGHIMDMEIITTAHITVISL